jgi:hypothetical protein
MGLWRMTSTYSLTRTCTNPPTSWLVHCYSTFGARVNHGQTQTHKIHHNLDLGETTTFPLIVYFVPFHEAHIQMVFCPMTPKWDLGVPKLPTLGLPRLWGLITLCVDFWLRWGLNQSYSLFQHLFSGMLHATWTRGNWVDSQLLVVGSQIANLTPVPSFGHNLCFRCPNGSCEPTLDI